MRQLEWGAIGCGKPLPTVSRLPSAKTDGSVTLDNGEAGPKWPPDIPGAGSLWQVSAPHCPLPVWKMVPDPVPLASTALNSSPVALGWDPSHGAGQAGLGRSLFPNHTHPTSHPTLNI